MLATPPATLLGDGQVEGRDEPEPSASRPVKPISSADWRLEPWQRQWRMNPPLPHSHVLDGLQEEYRRHQGIWRSFVFSYQRRSPLELFIAAMAWGLGTNNRGPAKVRTILAVNGQVRVAAGGQVKVPIPRLFSVLGQASSCLGPCLSHPE